jgi:signal transduction histidine kinase
MHRARLPVKFSEVWAMPLYLTARSTLRLVLVIAAATACARSESDDTRTLPFRLDAVRTFPASATPVDLNGDGRDEMLRIYRPSVNANRPDLEALVLEDADGGVIEQVNFNGRVQAPLILDTDGDHVPELLVPVVRADSLFVSLVDARGRKQGSFFLVNGAPRREAEGAIPWDPDVMLAHVVDANKDGKQDLVTVISTGYARSPRGVFVHDLATGRELGRLLVGSGIIQSLLLDSTAADGAAQLLLVAAATKNGAQAGGFDDSRAYLHVVSLSATPVVTHTHDFGGAFTVDVHYADLDADGRREILAASWGHWIDGERARLEVIETARWSVRQRRELPGRLSNLAIAQLNRTPAPEIVVARVDGEMMVFDGALETTLRRPSTRSAGFWIAATPDLDGDGIGELLAKAGANRVDLLGPDLSRRASVVVDSMVPAEPRQATVTIRQGAGVSPLLAFRTMSRLSAYRLAPNNWYLLHRFWRPALATITMLLTPWLGFTLLRLRRRTMRLRTTQTRALDATPFGILLLDRRANVEWMNATLRSWLGGGVTISARNPATAATTLAPIESLRRFCEMLGRAESRRQSGEGLTMLPTAPRDVVFEAEPMDGGRGGTDWLVQIKDATELGALTDSRTSALLAQRVAHDIKNPLTSMLLTVQQLRRAYRERVPEAADALDPLTFRIEERISQLRTMTSTFMKLTDADESTRERVQLNEFMGDAVRSLRSNIPPDIELRSALAPQTAMLALDPDQIESLIQNLVTNAVNAMPHGGVLTITGSVVRGIRLERDELSRDYAQIEIMDTGVGMPPAVRARAFEPGYSTSPLGTGVGLAIVKRILHAHDGHIDLESEAGVGTVVTIYLPLAVTTESFTEAAMGEPVPTAVL